MPSKIKPTAVRLRPDKKAQVVLAHAQMHTPSLHAAILQLLDEALAVRGIISAMDKKSIVLAPKQVLAVAEAKAAHLAAPRRARSHKAWNLKAAGVPLGAQHGAAPKPGKAKK